MPSADRVDIAVRLAVAGLRVDGVPEPVTVSAGVAALAKDETAASLLRRADQALYAAKAGGRNCVVRARRRAPPRVDAGGATAPAAPARRVPGAPARGRRR